MSLGGIKQLKIRMWLVISVPDDNGTYQKVPLDISNFTSTFAKNSIPQASCCITVGATVPDTSRVSNLHYIVSRLAFKTRAVVYLQVFQGATFVPVGMGNNAELFANGNIIPVFEGYTTGSGYRRGASGAEYVISLEHWLTDLTASTALSPDLQPNTPFNTYFPAVPISDAPEGKDGGGAFGAGLAAGFNPDVLAQDLWGQGLRPYYAKIAQLNALGLDSSDYTGTGNLLEFENVFTSARNDVALAGLDRFLPANHPRYVPLQLRQNNSTQAIVQNITNIIINITARSFDGSTFWENIITKSSELYFDVIPLINTAVVVPSLSNFYYPWGVIYASEISSIELSTAMPRFLKGVIMGTPTSENSGYNDPANQSQEASARNLDFLSCGIYLGSNVGTVLVKSAPTWLSQPVVPYLSMAADNFIFNGNNRKQPAIKIDEKAIEYARVANSYAKLVYQNEILKHRAGTVSGKLRLDIAPGSVVAVEATGEAQPTNDQLGYPFFGMVEQTHNVIDCTTGSASTTFSLSNLRTAYENTNPALVATENPLYAYVWNGSGMFL